MLERLAGALALAMAVGAIAIGCGDADDGSNGLAGGSGEGASGDAVTTSSLSKAQFVRRADRICGQRRQQMQEELRAQLNESGGPNATEATLIEEARDSILIPGVQDQADAIRGLGAPRGDEESVSALVEAMQQGIASFEEAPASSFDEISRQFRRFDELAQKYGLRVCLFGAA